MFGTNVPVNPWAALAPVNAVVLLNAIDPVSPDAVPLDSVIPCVNPTDPTAPELAAPEIA
jgi:hypothetical protein